MSRENLELALRAMRAGARLPEPDIATLSEAFAPDHVFVPVVPDEREGRVGLAGYRAFLREVDDVIPIQALAVEGAVDLGPRTVLGVVSMRLAGSTSGVPVEQRVWSLMMISNGKITRTQAYLDAAEAVRAASLLE